MTVMVDLEVFVLKEYTLISISPDIFILRMYSIKIKH